MNLQNENIADKNTLVKMPWPHMQIRLIRAKETYLLANRGGFKTSLGGAPYVMDCAYEFPRGSGAIVGPSFEHLYDNTVNALIKALIDMGFSEDKHFVVRKKPPENWPKPYIQISSKKYDNLITWHTGFTQHLVSLERIGSSNALSVVCGFFDEAKLLDQATLMNEVFPIFRPFKNMPEHWKQSGLFMSKFFATDKLESPNRINWLLKMREKNDPVKNDVIITLQLALDQLKQEYLQSGVNRKLELKRYIKDLELRLSGLRKNLTLYIEANHEHTKLIQGEEWYQDKVDNLKDYELKVAIRNEDPTRPEDGYYPDFDTAVHCYSGKQDYDPGKPLIISADYQHSVSPIPIAQISKLPGADKESLNYIDEEYTLAPEGLELAVQRFCERYKNHKNKRIYYVYDSTATPKRNDASTYYLTVLNILKLYKWKVTKIFTGRQPGHYQKYISTKAWLRNEKGKTMDIRINQDKCKKMIVSITAAEAVIENGETKKQKKYENTARYPKLDQSETTHFSDAWDMTNHAVLKLNRIGKARGSGGSLGSR